MNPWSFSGQTNKQQQQRQQQSKKQDHDAQ